jgi:hypothetical protein
VKDSPFLLFGPAAAVWFGPYGIETALFPFQMLLGFTSTGTAQINEWQSPHWEWTTIPFLTAVLLLFLAYAFKALRERKVPMELFWTGGQCLLLILWVRYVSFAFIALAPPAVTLLDELLAKAPRLRPVLRVAVLTLMILLTWSGLLYTRTEVDQPVNYPVKEVNFLLARSIGGNTLHTFVAGGYLEFLYYPLGRTFFDGRSPSFTNQLADYSLACTNLETYHAFIQKYPFEIAILPYPEVLISASERNPPRGVMALMLPEKDWAPVYYGPYGAVFLKRIPKYSAAISEYAYKCLYPDDFKYLKWAVGQGQIKEKEALKELDRAFKEGAPVAKWTGRVAAAAMGAQR